jgi:hypothetical protein
MKQDGRLEIKINKEFKKKYKQFCEKNSFDFSKRIRALMKLDYSGKVKIN